MPLSHSPMVRAPHPSVYTIGPVLDLGGMSHSGSDRVDHSKIIGWLDAQLELSVVFLCFGSMGTFDAPQVREIALRFERSGHRLSWASAEPGWQTRWKL